MHIFRRLLIIFGLVGLAIMYGIPYIPYTYDFTADAQTGLAGAIVECRISNMSLCLLDVYSKTETSSSNPDVTTTTAIQFNTDGTAKVTITTTGLNPLDATDKSVVNTDVFYKVIGNKIYMSTDKDRVASNADDYSYYIANFTTIRAKGDTTDMNSFTALIFVLSQVIMIVVGLLLLALKKHYEK